MQILILGANQHTFAILDTLEQGSTPCQIVGWFDSDEVGDALATRYPNAGRIHSEEDLTNQIADKILIVGQGGDEADKESLLRDFARDSVPMILDQPACTGIFAVELDMIQRDTRAPMIPFHPASRHAVMARAAQWTRGTSPVGNIEQVAMERSLPDRTDESVRAALGRDALLLRRLMGDFQRVGAFPAKEVTSLANLSVQLTGQSSAIGRWSVNPITTKPGAKLVLTGEQGKIEISMPDDGSWELTSSSDAIANETLPSDDAASYADEIAAAVTSKVQLPTSGPTWEDAFRATDLADTACESVRRGKTLPISNERLTEEDTFKSLMAAGGCLIILILPLILLGISLLDGLEIPVQRSVAINVAKQERNFRLPADFAAVSSLRLTGKDNQPMDAVELPALSFRELFEKHGNDTSGQPAAYHLSRNDITFAPAADDVYQFEMDYEGSFRIWRGWPLVLLLPILLFLALQLLKLVFPKKTTEPVAE